MLLEHRVLLYLFFPLIIKFSVERHTKTVGMSPEAREQCEMHGGVENRTDPWGNILSISTGQHKPPSNHPLIRFPSTCQHAYSLSRSCSKFSMIRTLQRRRPGKVNLILLHTKCCVSPRTFVCFSIFTALICKCPVHGIRTK